MLKNETKQIMLNATSYIGEEPAVDFTATIPSETAVGTINTYVRNYELYNLHRSEMRRDSAEFQDKVWLIEDELASEMPVPEDVPEPMVEG